MPWPVRAGAQTFYRYTLVAADPNGYAVPAVKQIGYRCIGFTESGLEQPSTVADNGRNSIAVVLSGVILLDGTGLKQRHCGDPVWLEDNQTLSLTQTVVGPIGHIVEIRSSTLALVRVSPLGG